MQITDHVHAIKIPFQIKDPRGVVVERFVYAYLIYSKKICLIDSGVANSAPFIFDYLKKTDRSAEDISMLVLTHAHPDHIGSAKSIKEASGCKVSAHIDDKPWIEDIQLQAAERQIPNIHTLMEGSVDVDVVLNDGDILDLQDGLSLEVIHTPGHSKGSISLLLPQEGVLVSGDALPLAGNIPIYDDVVASVKSIEKLRDIEGIEVLLSSWDDPRKGDLVYDIMDESLLYLQRIHKTVIEIHAEDPTLDPMELCGRVIAKLGLPEMAANPLSARSFQASLDARDLEHK